MRCASLLLLLVVGACTTLTSQDASQKEAERYIIESERQWAESVASGDTSAVERILADDFIGVDPEGKMYSKAQMVADTRNAPKQYVSNHVNEVKVRFFGALLQSRKETKRGKSEPAHRSSADSCGPTPGSSATASGRL
jgi:hypothetical protein